MKAGSWWAVVAFVAVLLLWLLVGWWIARTLGGAAAKGDRTPTPPPTRSMSVCGETTFKRDTLGNVRLGGPCILEPGHTDPHVDGY